ncbi:MAG: hypothetical protein V1740_01280, partial [Candidatus Woesearchaeota archaeon]
MSYMKKGNIYIRENGHKVNIFKKVNQIKQDLKAIIPEIDSDKLIPIMSHCRRHYGGKLHYGRRGTPNARLRGLTKTEQLVYDYMIRQGYNPSTAYRWFLAVRLPEDVKEKLAKGLISYNVAMRISWNRKRANITNQGLL